MGQLFNLLYQRNDAVLYIIPVMNNREAADVIIMFYANVWPHIFT